VRRRTDPDRRVRVRARLPHRREDVVRLGQERLQTRPPRGRRLPPEGRLTHRPLAPLQGRLQPTEERHPRRQRDRDEQEAGQKGRSLHDGQLL